MQDLHILQKSVLFYGMTEQEIKEALDFYEAEFTSYKKGEYILHAGNKLNRFGFVLSGVVRVFMDDINGNHIVMASVTPGISFGESLCFLQAVDNDIYIMAGSDCRVMWLCCHGMKDNSYFADEKWHKMYMRFTSLLAGRTLAMNDRIQILSKHTLREKLYTYFAQCCLHYDSMCFDIDMDREVMAAYLGADRSALSRELSKLRREGFLDYHKNHFVIKKAAKK
jgi:CRP-like cAMP-binding protein